MQIQLKPAKTYATRANAEAAVTKAGLENLRYMVVANDEGRFHPIFVGTDAIHVIHLGFTVVG